jgi:hypothetical protein
MPMPPELSPEEILAFAESDVPLNLAPMIALFVNENTGLLAGMILAMQTAALSDCACEPCVIIRNISGQISGC